MKRTTNIALAALTAMAMLLGITACSDGDDYSDVGPAPEKAGGGGNENPTPPDDNKGGGTNSALPTGMIFDGDNGVVVNASGAVKKNAKSSKDATEYDVWEIKSGMTIWGAGGRGSGDGDVTLVFSMPSDWDDTTSPQFGNYGATVVSGGPGYDGKLTGLNGGPAGTSAIALVNGKVQITVDGAEVGNRMVAHCRYATKAGGINEVTWTVPVVAKPTITFGIGTTGGAQSTGEINGAAPGVGEAEFPIVAGALYYQLGSGKWNVMAGGATVAGAATTGWAASATDQTISVSLTGANAPTAAGANGLSETTPNGKKHIGTLTVDGNNIPTFTADSPSTKDATVVMHCGDANGFDLPVTIKVTQNGATATIPTGDAPASVVIPAPTFKSGSEGMVDGKNTTDAITSAKTIWLGKNAAADVTMEFAAPATGYVGVYTAKDKTDADVGTSVSGGTTSMTTAGSFNVASTATNGPFKVSYTGYKWDPAQKKLLLAKLTGTKAFELKVAKWPDKVTFTLATGPNPAKGTLMYAVGAGTPEAVTGNVVFTNASAALAATGGSNDGASVTITKPTDTANDAIAALSASGATGNDTVTIKTAGTYKLHISDNNSDPDSIIESDLSVIIGTDATVTVAAGEVKEIADPTFGTADAGYGGIAVANKATTSTKYVKTGNPATQKAIYLGKVGTGAADVVLNFTAPAGVDTPAAGDWTVAHKGGTKATGTAFDGTTAGKLTINGTAVNATTGAYEGEASGTLVVTFTGTKDSGATKVVGTYEIEVKAWPTLSLSVHSGGAGSSDVKLIANNVKTNLDTCSTAASNSANDDLILSFGTKTYTIAGSGGAAVNSSGMTWAAPKTWASNTAAATAAYLACADVTDDVVKSVATANVPALTVLKAGTATTPIVVEYGASDSTTATKKSAFITLTFEVANDGVVSVTSVATAAES